MVKLSLVAMILVISLLCVHQSFSHSQSSRPGPRVGSLLDEDLIERSVARRHFSKSPAVVLPENYVERSSSPSSSAISGTKRIGAGKDYATIGAAFNDINMNGVSGPVTLLLADTLYVEPGMLLLSIIGGSATNTVMLMPDSNVTTATVMLTSNPAYGGGIVAAGVSYFTIQGTRKNGAANSRDLTVMFDPSQTLPANFYEAPIRIRDGCSHLTIENTNIYGMYNPGFSAATPVISSTTTVGPNNDVLLRNNLITTGSYGILWVAGDDLDLNLRIDGNDIGGAFSTLNGDQRDYIQLVGIYFEWTDNALVQRNRVAGVRRNVAATGDASRTCGIRDNFGINGEISYNIVDDISSIVASSGANARTYGIRVASLNLDFGGPANTNNKILNNCVTRVRATVSGNRDIGIEVLPAGSDYLYHNSIYHTGVGVTSATCVQLGNSPAGSIAGNVTAYNNVFAVDRTGAGDRAIFRIFNNSGSVDLTSSDNNVLYNSVDGTIDIISGLGWSEWNAGYASHPDLRSSPFDPKFIGADDLHIDSTDVSSAENLGRPLFPPMDFDFDGQVRDSVSPDAGYDEVGGPSTLDKDIMAVSILSPTSSGFPKGLPVPSTTIRFRNNTLFPASYSAVVRVFDPSSSEISGSPFSVAVPSHAPMSSLTVVVSLGFTPTMNGLYTFEAISDLSGDLHPENDTNRVEFLAVPLIAIGAGYCTTLETPSEQAGWYGDNDFELADFTKLGGPRSGTNAFVTVAGPPGTLYHEGGIISHVYSPFFDFTGITSANLSFYQSIATEPNWDRSIMEYTLDSGKTWIRLGNLNDTTGINWYNLGTYQNAAGDYVNCFDIGRAVREGFPTSGPGWTSNGDCEGADVPTGPDGYVYNEIKIPNAIYGKTYVRFRYSAFSDGFGGEDGWAFDDFCIGLTGASANASLAGKLYLDGNGNGSMDAGELPILGGFIQLSGSSNRLDTTDVNGDFDFANLLPGLYSLGEFSMPGGVVITQPVEGNYSGISLAPAEVVGSLDFGNFESSVGGMVFSDLNDDAVLNSEPGLSGWTIQIRKAADSAVVAAASSNASGLYSFTVPPGEYLLSEVGKTGWRRTLPAGGGWYTGIVVDTVSGATNISGKDFGNFEYGRLRVDLLIDLNGNGIKDGGDVFALPFGVNATFELSKNGTPIKTALLGNVISSMTFDSLNQGVYRIRESVVPTGWIRTAGGVSGFHTRTISGGSVKDTARYLHFALNTVSGKKFRDLNNNGAKDPGEPGLAGWKIKLSGAMSATSTTDSVGAYSFSNLGPGSYVVAESLQAGWTQTFPAGAGTYSFNALGIPPSSVRTNLDFGNYSPAVGVEEEPVAIPRAYALRQNYPNPFNPKSVIRFEMPEANHVRLVLYNLLGEEVLGLVDEVMAAGVHDIVFDATLVPSGVYFYRLVAGTFSSVRKLMIMK